MNNIQEQLNKLEKEIFDKQQEAHQLRKKLPKVEVKNYNFQQPNGTAISLLDLFGDKDELLLIHNMGKSCVYCTMWADGLRGYTDMIQDKMAFVLTSPDAPDVLKNFAEPRHWNFHYVSYHATPFAHEMDFAYDKEGRTWYQPGFSALIKEGDKIYRTGKNYFGPGDYYCPPWHFFEHFPKGVNGWEPKYKY